MLVDLNDVEPGKSSSYDVCIVGAGAAGISIARKFLGTARSVALLESGGFEYERDTHNLYAGKCSGHGLSERDAYLTASRLRMLGGTTMHWTGMCRPLDPYDFQARSWIPHSGWPIEAADLQPYFDEASANLEIEPFPLTRDDLSQPDQRVVESDQFVHRRYHRSPPTRFGTRYRKELLEAKNVTLFLHANLTRLALGSSGQQVKSADVSTLGGKSHQVTAKVFILATGGIENARILLSNQAVLTEGLGNRHGNVGR